MRDLIKYLHRLPVGFGFYLEILEDIMRINGVKACGRRFECYCTTIHWFHWKNENKSEIKIHGI